MSPIRPENKKLYPSNWAEISRSVRTEAGNKCELCGVSNYTIRDKARIILTVAHLDNDPTNNERKNLKALCQRCHNRYDAAFRAKNRRANAMKDREEAGQVSLFIINGRKK